MYCPPTYWLMEAVHTIFRLLFDLLSCLYGLDPEFFRAGHPYVLLPKPYLNLFFQ
jgi:hypothetical protein